MDVKQITWHVEKIYWVVADMDIKPVIFNLSMVCGAWADYAPIITILTSLPIHMN